MRNERTSKEIAKIASEVLQMKGENSDPVWMVDISKEELIVLRKGPALGKLKALAGSCLTQAPDKPKPVKRTRKVSMLRGKKRR